MLAFLVVKQYHKGQKERPTRVIEALMDRLASETARRSILETLNTIISLEVIPDAHLGVRIMDHCVALSMSLPVRLSSHFALMRLLTSHRQRDNEALPDILKLIGLLCGNVSYSGT